MGKFAKFARLAETEYSDLIVSTHDLGPKLRIYFKDKSFIDFFFSEKLKTQRFAIHWERTHVDGTIFRLDNTPDQNWKQVKTFPVHFHDQKYQKVKSPPFAVSANLTDLLREFLFFVRQKMQS